MKKMLTISLLIGFLLGSAACKKSDTTTSGSGPDAGAGSDGKGGSELKSQDINFDNWLILAGTYKLISFEGVNYVNNDLITTISIENDRYKNHLGAAIELINIHLINSVSGDNMSLWNFGPMKQSGLTVMTKTSSGALMYIYDCKDVVLLQDQKSYKATLHVEVTRSQTTKDLIVKYRLNVPGVANNVSHTYVLTPI